MHPVLFKIGSVNIYSYGFMVAVGFVLAVFLISRTAKESGVSAEWISDLCLLMLISGIIGARALYVLVNWDMYKYDVLEVFRLSDGGLAFYGGFFCALIFSALYVRKSKLSLWVIGDIIAPYVALAHSLGRIGCFLNGCCFGKPTALPWGVCFPGADAPVHPTQIYSALSLLFIYVLLRYLYDKRRFDGQIFLLYFIIYGVERFLMEFVRGDSAHIFLGLTIWQIISAGLFLTATGAYLFKLWTPKPIKY